MKHLLKSALPIFMFSGLLLLSSCKKDTPPEPNEEELITTVELDFIPEGGTDADEISFEWKDLDGNGIPNEIDPIILDKGKKYNVEIEVYNKSVIPEEDITEEIESEKESHRFYYIPEPAGLLTINGFDKDVNNVSVGLKSIWETSANVATGEIRVVLRHYAGTPPNKLENDAVDSPKSSTDIDITFPVEIK
ncbi:MAG: hypothetical protein FGM46_00390 [Ferruginibacter sp.]|nr:hypothetical protein [Ferruginibacter sp.]